MSSWVLEYYRIYLQDASIRIPPAMWQKLAEGGGRLEFPWPEKVQRGAVIQYDRR